MMVWGGNMLRVSVATNRGIGGKWVAAGSIRNAYAVKDNSGDVQLLIPDDDGELQWVSKIHCKVEAAPVIRG